MTEYTNIDDIVITDDEFIYECFKNVHIQQDLKQTNYMKEVRQKINNLAYDTFLKIGIDIATYQLINETKKFHDYQKIEEQQHSELLSIYKAVCLHLLNNDILSEEEMSSDWDDLKSIDCLNFWTQTAQYLGNFSQKFCDYASQFYHA